MALAGRLAVATQRGCEELSTPGVTTSRPRCAGQARWQLVRAETERTKAPATPAALAAPVAPLTPVAHHSGGGLPAAVRLPAALFG